jgi:RimJ/RimL family protein N-acetyltransferase
VTELTFFTIPEHRRRGFAEEAARAALAHAYDVWDWPEVETVARDENAPARALIAKLGGARTGRRIFPDGHERDVFRLPRPARAGDGESG